MSDQEALRELIANSARVLSEKYYEPCQVEAALQGAFGVDTSLIEDGTYFVARSGDDLIGCGGWSRRRTLFGGDRFRVRDAALLNPETGAARIRAFFVHPEWTRRGVARCILERCETEATRAGFTRFELMATRPGLPFYQACGYDAGQSIPFDLAGVAIEFISMTKNLTPNE